MVKNTLRILQVGLGSLLVLITFFLGITFSEVVKDSKTQKELCVNNLKQLGQALHLYAQDYGGRFPRAFRGMAVKDLNVLAPAYASSAKMFVCPGGGDKAQTGELTSTSLAPANLSYAYARDCTEKTNADTALLADQSWPNHKGSPWDTTLTGIGVNHGTDGVNVLYVDGHVEWVPRDRISERIPNVYTEISNFPVPNGGLYNPGHHDYD